VATISRPKAKTAAKRPPLGPISIRVAPPAKHEQEPAPPPESKPAGQEWEESLAGRFWSAVDSAQRNPTYIVLAVLAAIGLAVLLFALLHP
jgi:hypothetical protein